MPSVLVRRRFRRRELAERLQVRDDTVELCLAFESGRGGFDVLVGIGVPEPAQRLEARDDGAVVRGALG